MNPQYARLQTDVPCKLRRGAWYRVLRLAAVEAVLDVARRELAVPRAYLQIVPTPPQRWTVVPVPPDALRVPASWGQKYGVCPNCRTRASVLGQPPRLRCERCNGLFDVAWDESYLQS
jgi:hypothetical protein